MKEIAPKVSMIIPVYNVEKYLKKCVESVINQTLKDIEIILINDGSTDNSPEICNQYAQQDERIKLITQENKGLSAARNTGMKFAKGDYIAFLDSDDWIDLNFCEKLYNSAIDTDADIAAASIIRKRKYHQKYRVKYRKIEAFTDLQRKIEVCKGPQCCYVWNKIYKKSALEKSGVIFREGVYFEDMEFTMRILKELNKLITVPGASYYYRVNHKSIVKTTSRNEKMGKDYFVAKDCVNALAKEYGIVFSEKGRMTGKKRFDFLSVPIFTIRHWEEKTKYYLFDIIPLLEIKRWV